jgi:glycosyltransferase involved in cell wall biosynthesis
MDLLLVLEHHFYKDEHGDVWCDRVVDREFIERYLQVFDNVTVCARMVSSKTIQCNYHKVNGERTEFLSLPDFVGLSGLLFNVPKMVRIFSSNCRKFDSVIFRAPTPLSLVLYRWCIGKIKVGVEFVMGADKFLPETRVINRITNRIIDKEAQRLCIRANAVSYVTSQSLQNRYPSYSIEYGPDDQHFDASYSSANLEDRNYFEKEWSVEDKPELFNIAHVGYMDNDRKGHEILIRAAGQIIDKGVNIVVTLVGDGALKNRFRELCKSLGIEDRVIFCGATNDKNEIIELLKKTHLFVLPSKSEGLPRVIIEAMATGTPCIASGVDGIPELLSDDCIVKSFDPRDYADKIIELLDDWERMIRISKSNYALARQFHHCILEERRTEFYRRLKEMQVINRQVM